MRLSKSAAELFNSKPTKILELLHVIGYWPKKYDLYDNFLLDISPVISNQLIKELSSSDSAELFKQYQDVPGIQDFIIKNSKKIAQLPPEKIKIYLDIFCKINDLSIPEIKYLKIPLLVQLLESRQPIDDYQKIEAIFINDDLSLVDKIYGAFEILHGPNLIAYQDLIKIHSQSTDNDRATLEIRADNFIRAINIEHFDSIIKNGCVAKEFLGEGDDSNCSPFNIRVSRVKPDYGDLLLVLKDCDKYHLTAVGKYYELRTGFSYSDIDFMIARNDIILSRPKQLEQIFIKIAQAGFYLPVTDESGKLIFTPEMYHKYCKTFAGVEKFSKQKLFFKPTAKEERSYLKIISLAKGISENYKHTSLLTEMLFRAIKKVFVGLNVNSQTKFFDIGSTNRQTNTPENFDLDFIFKLEAKDFSRVTEIAQGIENVLTFDREYFYNLNEGYYQFGIKDITAIGEQKLKKTFNLDISFLSLADLDEYSTHDAISDKLNYIKHYYGVSAYEQVIANIILTKQILKANDAYKIGKFGGIGGPGVENWVLANGGNMEEAFRSFQSVAYEDGQRLTCDKFQEKYKIWNAGANNRLHIHGNFIDNLKSNGYEAMLNIIEDYFKN
jgi:hypothetical protein